MNKINYQKVLDQLTDQLKGKNEVPKLLLHSCCAPCSSYCLEYLSEYFEITVLYYNPNIYPKEEYDKRVEEQARLIRKCRLSIRALIEGKFEPEKFFEMAKGLETSKKAAKDVLNVMNFVFGKLRRWQRPADMTILRRR